MSNPYDPPKTNAYGKAHVPSFYAGGFGGLATISILIGAIVGKLLDVFALNPELAPLIGLAIPMIGWLVATSFLFYFIGNSNLTEDGKVLFALLLPIPACLLYLPVWAASSVGTMPYFGARIYGEMEYPSSSGMIVASAFSFFVIQMLIAIIVQVKYKVRDSDARKRPND